MKFELATPISGFEEIREVELEKLDEYFATLKSSSGIAWSLVNPYALRDYNIKLSLHAQILLDIKKDSALEVYCMMILQNPLEDSKVNFLSPFVFNLSNKKAMQFHCDIDEYPSYLKLEALKHFAK